MNFGVVMRTDIPLASVADLAHEAETSGWDGFFLWDSFAKNPCAVPSAVMA